MAAADLLADPGVLIDAPCAEWAGFDAVRRCGGWAVLPLRGDWLAAGEAGVDAVPAPAATAAGWCGGFAQAVVQVDKSRAGTWAALAQAWTALAPGGRLLVVGGNELGIATTVKRLGHELGQVGELLVNRAKARAVAFARDDGPGPAMPPVERVAVALPDGGLELAMSPGTFGAGRLDRGSALLLEHLDALGAPRRVVDLGAGCGVLGLAAARGWPGCRVELLEADSRALDDAKANVAAAGVEAAFRWWDSERDPPPDTADAVVCNPPFHQGKGVDYGPARAMFAAIDACLAPGGRALVVANRQLPYEADLRRVGSLHELAARDGFKLLLVERTG